MRSLADQGAGVELLAGNARRRLAHPQCEGKTSINGSAGGGNKFLYLMCRRLVCLSLHVRVRVACRNRDDLKGVGPELLRVAPPRRSHRLGAGSVALAGSRWRRRAGPRHAVIVTTAFLWPRLFLTAPLYR